MTTEPNATDEQQPVDLDTEPATDPEPHDSDTGDIGHANAEAAKWRIRFRATETENTVLQAKIDQMENDTISRTAAEVLIDGNDWQKLPIDINELRDDLGVIDHNKIRAHALKVGQTHRHLLRARTPAASAITSDRSPYDDTDNTPTWHEKLRGRAR